MNRSRFVLFSAALLACFLLGSSVSAQPVSVTWPLTSSMTATSSQPAWVTGNAGVLSGGTFPTVSIFDYWSGQAQRLNAGTTGWTAGPASDTRYLQFDAVPAPGNQLQVSSVSFMYGGANVANQIRAEARYSTDNWNSFTVLAPALLYAPTSMSTFTMPVTAPAIPSGGKFSLRIMPYAIVNSTAMAPTFAAHRNVMINGTNLPASVPHVRLHITKSTGAVLVPGTYNFHISCSGPNGPYTSSVSVVLPGPTVIEQIPQGSTCTVNEAPVSGWGTPTWTATNSTVAPTGPWSAQVGPMNVNTALTVNNHPVAATVNFDIRKSFLGNPIPGVYTFAVSCTNGYSGPSTVSISVPSNNNSASIQVPLGATCTFSESPVPGWNTPSFGSGQPVSSSQAWTAVVGPIMASDRVVVTNRPH